MAKATSLRWTNRAARPATTQCAPPLFPAQCCQRFSSLSLLPSAPAVVPWWKLCRILNTRTQYCVYLPHQCWQFTGHERARVLHRRHCRCQSRLPLQKCLRLYPAAASIAKPSRFVCCFHSCFYPSRWLWLGGGTEKENVRWQVDSSYIKIMEENRQEGKTRQRHHMRASEDENSYVQIRLWVHREWIKAITNKYRAFE